MTYPRVKINLEKIKHNTKKIVNMCNKIDIDVAGVTKVFCAHKKIVKVMIDGGINIVADSRIENLKKLQEFNLPKMLLRLPMKSRTEEVVKYADISLNSELDTIKEISKSAVHINKVHKVILMIDLGDLREGVFDKEQVFSIVSEVMKLKGVIFHGIGTNLTCYGGVIPNENNLGKLVDIKKEINSKFNIDIEVISGGNSSSIHLINDSNMPKGINQLRIGEGIVLGRETAYGEDIQDTYNDCFKLEFEIVEQKEKPSIPIGQIGMDAFGNKPQFEDKGLMRRAICAIGRQDVDPSHIILDDENIEIIGASSDHLIIDVTNSEKDYKVGDIISSRLSYGGVLAVMTSKYVEKKYINS